MAKVSDGTYVSLPAVKEELDELAARRAVLAAELADVDQRSETLRHVLDFGLAEAGGARRDAAAATPTPRPAETSRSRSAVRATGSDSGRKTRDVIVAVLGTLPPGMQFSTSQLYERMVAEYGYASERDTVRRSAQRMSERGDLVKLGPGLWQTVPNPSAGDSTS